MRRRQLARIIGAGSAGLGLTSTVSARGEGELPNDHVDTVRIHPFANDKEDPITVPAGTWLEHSIGWIDTGEQNKSDVQTFLDSVEYAAWIDGEEIENPEQYWGDIYWDAENERWTVWWIPHTTERPRSLHLHLRTSLPRRTRRRYTPPTSGHSHSIEKLLRSGSSRLITVQGNVRRPTQFGRSERGITPLFGHLTCGSEIDGLGRALQLEIAIICSNGAPHPAMVNFRLFMLPPVRR